jgi:Flp pilus assembly protein TadB
VTAEPPGGARSAPRGSDPELSRALSFLGWRVGAREFRRLTRGTALAGGAIVAAATLAATGSPGIAAGIGCLTALCGVVGGGRVPLALAHLRRTRALGDAGTLVGLVVLRMRIEPTVEAAVEFASSAGEGPLARSLGANAERARGSGRAGLDAFAAEWSPWFPATARAASLVAAAAATPAADRDETLDRALGAVQRGTRDRLADFLSAIRGPVSGLYAFGVLLPLALVGLLPAARVAGLGVSVRAVAVVYDVLLPAALVAAGGWLLGRRPVAFPPPHVGRTHPDVPDRRASALFAGVAAGAVGWVLAGRLVATWSAPVAAVGCGAGAGLVVVGHAPKQVRDRIRAVEAGLPDALARVGRRVADGEALETALAAAGEEVAGPTGARLAAAAWRMERLGEGPQRALCGPAGAFESVRSRRVRGAASMLALAATEGAPAGRALVSLAEELDALAAVESEARRELGRVTDTLTNTATAFGPLVAGATVALAARVAAEGSGPLGGGLSVGPLGLAVGGYVLVSAAVLTALATALVRGLDRALLTYRVGLALPTATATYLTATVGARLVVGA